MIEEYLTNFANTLENCGCMQCSARHPNRLRIAKPIYVRGSLPSVSPIVLVLSHPRESDEQMGKILSGADKTVLKTWLPKHRTDMYITSAVKCRTTGDRSPRKKEISICASRYLHNEIIVTKPKVVIALGKTAVQAVCGCPNIEIKDLLNTRMNRALYIDGKLGWKGAVYATYHPGFFKMSAGTSNIDENTCIKLIHNAFQENINGST